MTNPVWKSRPTFPFVRADVVAATTLLILCGLVTAINAQTTAGSITTLAGGASIQRAAGTVEARVGMTVLVADEISVRSGGDVQVTLTDGSILEVRSSSTIVVDRQLIGPGAGRTSTRIRLLKGILRSLVRHSARGNPNFEVHTPNAILAARATEFDTSYTQGQRRVGYGRCTEFTDEQTYIGTVGARNAITPSPETLVEAGYEITIACDAPPTAPGPLGLTGIPIPGASVLSSGVGAGTPPPSLVPPPCPPSRP
jgi:hypothetical protein